MATIPYKKASAATSRFPAISVTRRDPALAAIASKAETGRSSYFTAGGVGSSAATHNGHMARQILAKRAKRNSDAAAAPKILPDIELAIQILVASITSPQDMTSVELLYTPPSDVLNSELTASVMARIKRHFDETYVFKDKLSILLREALFEKGAYAVAVIPENAIDQLINGVRAVSTESIKEFLHDDGTVRQLGILGKSGVVAQKESRLGLSMESIGTFTPPSLGKEDTRVVYYDTPHLSDNSDLIGEYDGGVAAKEEYLLVTDNPTVLRLPSLNAATRSNRVRDMFASGIGGFTMESLSQDKFKVANAVFRQRPHASEPVAAIPSQNELDRRSVGEPLVMKLPSESVLPVHVPGNPTQHVAYLILIDEEGNPLESPDGDQLYSSLKQTRNTTLSSNLIRKASLNLGIEPDAFDPNNQMHARFASSLYAEMVERDIISRIQNGVYAKQVTISNNEHAYRLMFSRVLAKKYTQILYIPVEYMTYFAFKYTDDGIGRSLLDDQSVLFTMRATLLFSDILGAVKNSIGRSRVSVEIDPADSDPMKTLEMMQDEFVRSRSVSLPFSMSNPDDFTTFLQRAAIEWEFTHPKLPVAKVDVQQVASTYQRPDGDLQESLRKTSIMGLGLQPEAVDQANGPDFAKSVVQGNVLLQKRVIGWQDQLNPMITDHLRKYAMASRSLIDDVKQLLENSYDGIRLELDPEEMKGVDIPEDVQKRVVISRALHLFLSSFKVELPKPSSVTLEGQLEDLESYSKALDSALDAYLSSDVFTENVSGNFGSEQINTLKAMYKGYFMRKYLAEKGVMSEVAELVTEDDNGPGIDRITKDVISYTQRVASVGVKAFSVLKATADAINKDLDETGVTLPDNTTTTDTSSSGGSSFGGDSGGDFGGDSGLGDLNFGDDTPPDGDDADADTATGTGDDSTTDDTPESGGDQSTPDTDTGEQK